MRLLILIVILAATIGLQIFLSKRENKWFGLILPIISFLFAVLIVPLNMMVPATGIDISFLITLVLAFALYNIPTILFGVIYAVCRKRKRKKHSN